ncbi:substrate-binding periplasmic protein [Pseudodesulfovibrio sp.]|uniref:substrate-binding periplasmic protein n=1 Tax=unclassified Pseudodesulfovibrio TaxID=2661612 RepID=UPI003B001B00
MLLLILTCSTHVFGASLRVVTENWPPYNYEKNGQAVGLVTEVVRATLDRAGVDYTIEVLPWARAYRLARQEPNVLIYSMYKLPEREEMFQWIAMDGLNVDTYIMRPKTRNDIRINTLEEAKAYRIGVTRDAAPHLFLLKHGFVEGKQIFPVCNELFNILKSQPQNDRIDLTTCDLLSQIYRLQEAGIASDYWVPVLPLLSENLYMAFSLETDKKMVDRISNAFGQIRQEGILETMVQKYRKMLEQNP